MIAVADERGFEEQVREQAQLFQWRRQFLVALLRRLLSLGCKLPFHAGQRILRGGLLSKQSSADVGALNATVDTRRSCVITSLSSP